MIKKKSESYSHQSFLSFFDSVVKCGICSLMISVYTFIDKLSTYFFTYTGQHSVDVSDRASTSDHANGTEKKMKPKIFRRTKFSSKAKNFVTFVRRKIFFPTKYSTLFGFSLFRLIKISFNTPRPKQEGYPIIFTWVSIIRKGFEAIISRVNYKNGLSDIVLPNKVTW